MNLNAPSVPGALPLFPLPPWPPQAAKGASRAERGEGTRQEQCPQNFLLISEDTETLGPSEMRSLKFCDEKGGKELCLSIKTSSLRGLYPLQCEAAALPGWEPRGAERVVESRMESLFVWV